MSSVSLPDADVLAVFEVTARSCRVTSRPMAFKVFRVRIHAVGHPPARRSRHLHEDHAEAVHRPVRQLSLFTCGSQNKPRRHR